MTATALTGALLGLALGVGLVVIAARIPAARRPTLEQRLAPYLRDAPPPSRLRAPRGTISPFPTLERILEPVLRDGIRAIERTLGGASSVRSRLAQAGSRMTVEQFRAQQVLCGLAGLGSAAASCLLLLAAGTLSKPIPAFVGCLAAGVTGVLARDRFLTVEVRRREHRMLAEFPTIAELLALAVAAGEGPVGALHRVTRISRGELARELGWALAEARAGASLVSALTGVGSRTRLPALARFADGISVAVERGTPLADVLRAQAVDVREAGKRELLETGGRKEIAMMIPVVFLVLPVTIVFALYPGIMGLSFTA